MAGDYYEILGVPRDATEREIKGAYRRLVMALHPDRAGSESEAFLRVREAYDVLGDPERRAGYDRRVPRERLSASRPRAEPFRRRTAEPLSASPRAAFAEPDDLEDWFEAVWRDFERGFRTRRGSTPWNDFFW